MGIFDYLFPKYCVSCKKLGSYICPDCFSFISFNSRSTCLVCQNPSIDGLTHPKCLTKYSIDGAFSSLEYKGTVKKLLYVFKYKPFVSDLNKTLCDLFYEGIIQNEEFNRVLNEDFILIPIPLSKEKLRKRGYNQSEILAGSISQKLKLKAQNLLERVKNTKSQFSLSKEERRENIKEAFRIKRNVQVPKYIFLIDDVLTTGSTLVEAANVLKRNGAEKVFGLTLARD